MPGNGRNLSLLSVSLSRAAKLCCATVWTFQPSQPSSHRSAPGWGVEIPNLVQLVDSDSDNEDRDTVHYSQAHNCCTLLFWIAEDYGIVVAFCIGFPARMLGCRRSRIVTMCLVCATFCDLQLLEQIKNYAAINWQWSCCTNISLHTFVSPAQAETAPQSLKPVVEQSAARVPPEPKRRGRKPKPADEKKNGRTQERKTQEDRERFRQRATEH